MNKRIKRGVTPFLYSRKVLLVGELSADDKHGEPKIFLKFPFARKS